MPFSAPIPVVSPDASSEEALLAQLKGARRQVHLKQFELDTVISVAQGMTADDFTEDNLYQMLVLTLQGQRQVGRVLLFAREENGDYHVRLNLRAGRMVLGGSFLTLPSQVAAYTGSRTLPLADMGLENSWSEFELAIPVLRQQQPVAYLFVGGLPPATDLDRRELADFLSSLVIMLVGAVEHRRLTQHRIAAAAARKEIEIAQEVQNMLFPSRLPHDADLVVARSYVPHAEIGGDYYDVVEVDADNVVLCVADVSGKGVPASLLMSNFQAGLRTLLRQGADLATIVPELNHLLFRNSGGEKFITAFLGMYNRRTRRLQYVNAGHNDPLLLCDNGRVEYLKTGTVMLGIIEHLPSMAMGEVSIDHGSLLFLYTDGLTEVFSPDGEEFGEEGVLRTLQRNRYLPLPALHKELLSEIKAFNTKGDKFADDVTILSCRFK